MLCFAPFRLLVLCVAGPILLVAAPARAADYEATGTVLFTNIQNGLNSGADVPYYAAGLSDLIGVDAQFGSIRPTSKPTPVSATELQFTGEVGPNPLLPFGPKIHVIATPNGLIYCTWTATFTIQFVSATDVVFSGDGAFTVVGGTGKYKGATGTFRTLFATDSIPLTSDSALAKYSETGTIVRK